jgi:hypothetical protein
LYLQIRLAEPDDAVILDGELVVWNKSRGVFEPFGGVRSAMNAARERVPPDHVSSVTHKAVLTGQHSWHDACRLKHRLSPSRTPPH